MIFKEVDSPRVTRLDDEVRLHFNRDRVDLTVRQAWVILAQLVQVLEPFPEELSPGSATGAPAKLSE